MALYNNKQWLLSHIWNSFISTDDTGMCEVVMSSSKIAKKVAATLDSLPPSESSDEEDDLEHQSYDLQPDMDFGIHRIRSNTAVRLEKMDLARKRASKVKHIKWETIDNVSFDNNEDLFKKKEIVKRKPVLRSLLTEQLEKYTNMPQNPYIEYAKFDGTAMVGVTTRTYKIFLTMLPEEQRNYPIDICCIATAKIQDLIGLICLKSSTIHGEYIQQPVSNYGLFITEEDGEVDRDFPCLDPKEGVAKFGFNCLGLVEMKSSSYKMVTFEVIHNSDTQNDLRKDSERANTSDDSRQISADLQLMKVHTTAMEAPLYQSYKVFILNKMRTKIEVHLGISGEKLEIDPVQQKTSKFSLSRQKAVSHHIDSIAWCEIIDTKSSKSYFRVLYSPSFGNQNTFEALTGTTLSPVLQSSVSFKHYDFEADHHTAEEIVQKINLILELRSSTSRKEYLAARERKLYKSRKS